MLKTPLLSSRKIVFSLLTGTIRRNEFPDLPVTIEELEAQNDLFKSSTTDQKTVIHCGDFGLELKRDNDFDKINTPNTRIAALSISKGNFKNILAIHKLFSDLCGTQIYNYTNLMSKLRKTLVSNSKLLIKISASNLGQTPVILKPHFSLSLEYGEKKKIFVFESRKFENKKKDNPQILFIDSVRSDKYKGYSSNSSLVNISGGSTVDIELISLDELDDDSELISEFYEIGGLTGQAFAKTEHGSIIKSKKSLFCKGISEAEKRQLTNIAQENSK